VQRRGQQDPSPQLDKKVVAVLTSVRLVIGNPLIMKEMVKHVPDAASYAPVLMEMAHFDSCGLFR
jgi:hypothetical protein